jgi:hypothetical protein
MGRSNGLNLTSTVGRTLHSIKSIIALAAFYQLEILLFLHRCLPFLTASAPSALFITANLPTFIRLYVPTYLELSVSQLAAFCQGLRGPAGLPGLMVV